MIDPTDLFDINVNVKIGDVGALQADTTRRITATGERLTALEQRYERMRLVNVALWQLLKSHTGLTDADLKQYSPTASWTEKSVERDRQWIARNVRVGFLSRRWSALGASSA